MCFMLQLKKNFTVEFRNIIIEFFRNKIIIIIKFNINNILI